MTQWENLPQPLPERAAPVAPVAASWSGFSADPRQPANQGLRASDADRGFAARVVDQAMAEGRLDQGEHAERLLRAAQARTLGELVPLVSDVMVASAARGVGVRARGRLARAGLNGWLGLALMLNAIWVMTCLTTGQLLYYWPMWPMLGTGIPVLMALFWGGTADGRGRQDTTPPVRPATPPALPPGDDLR